MWTVHTGTQSRRYPWWISDGSGKFTRAVLSRDGVQIRKFATAEAAQRVADQLNRRDYASHEIASARRHLQAALQCLTRATRDSEPTDPRLAVASQVFDAWSALGPDPAGSPAISRIMKRPALSQV